jgi:hypothetical protein
MKKDKYDYQKKYEDAKKKKRPRDEQIKRGRIIY